MENEINKQGPNGFIHGICGSIKNRALAAAVNVKKMAQDDPRKIIHSLKVALALTLVSLFYYFHPLYNGFGVSTMWAVMTVVVVFEYTVGATISKSLNRAMATVLAGALGVGANYLAECSGERAEPFVLGAFVFMLSAAATFCRFFPGIKARYDYGVMIFILTFSLIAVSGYRVKELIQLAHQRLSTVLIGVIICMFISVFISPVWAGAELHKQVARNIKKLGCSLEEFRNDFNEDGEADTDETAAVDNGAAMQAYKSVLNSRSSSESLANWARWEPSHGNFKIGHPWAHYLKINNSVCGCASTIEALNACTKTKTKEFLAQKKNLHVPCIIILTECAKAMKEMGSLIQEMIMPSSAQENVSTAKDALASLNFNCKKVLLDNISVSDILPIITLASFLVEIVNKVEQIYKSTDELAKLAKFKSPTDMERKHSYHHTTVKHICRCTSQVCTDIEEFKSNTVKVMSV